MAAHPQFVAEDSYYKIFQKGETVMRRALGSGIKAWSANMIRGQFSDDRSSHHRAIFGHQRKYATICDCDLCFY